MAIKSQVARAAVCAGFAAALASCAGVPPRGAQPNLIVVVADDMGYGDASVYDGWIEMPQLERMAAAGLVFTDFHTSGIVCSPTRAGLVTGRYQQRAGIPGVINADPKLPDHHRGLQPDEVTFAELLRDAGYATALFGKWHLGYHAEFNPIHHGFDQFRGFISGNIDYVSHRDRMGTHDWWDGDERAAEPGYLTHLITQHAVRFIDDHAAVPFCLYIPHGAPHAPIQAPDSPALRGPLEGPKETRPRDERTKLMMQALDDSVGAILDSVERNGIARRTFVVFLSDNGGAKHLRNDPLRGRKGSVWEGGHRVPALAWWPGHIAPGRTAQLASSLDIMPTMLELAGVDASALRKLDGTSLIPLLKHGKSLGQRQLFWNGVAMRDGPWKLIAKTNQSPQLFQLHDDIGERNDIAAQHPARVAAMLDELAAWRQDIATTTNAQPRMERFAQER